MNNFYYNLLQFNSIVSPEDLLVAPENPPQLHPIIFTYFQKLSSNPSVQHFKLQLNDHHDVDE